MTVVIQNASTSLFKALKELAKIDGAEILSSKKEIDPILQALEEVKNGEYTDYDSFDDFKRAMNE